MRPLTASQLLSLWEYGLQQPAWQRAISLLAAAFPERSPDALAEMPIGWRDDHLLTLRESVFGPHLVSLVTCPACGENLELSFNIADIRTEHAPENGSEFSSELKELLSLDMDGYHVAFRLPNSHDLAVISELSDPVLARRSMLARCLDSAEKDGTAHPAAELPEPLTAAIAERMASADPHADIQIALNCPDCSHQWDSAFDILSFFWTEIHAWAQRILREVHLLASAYGWNEAEILSLSPRRRQAYLQLAIG